MDKRQRHLSIEEREALQQRGCYAEEWDKVIVADDFHVEQLRNVRFEGSAVVA